MVKPSTTKYMTLACSKPAKVASKGSVVCEDIFTAVVVFSSASWEASEELPPDKRGEGGIPTDILQAAFPPSSFAGACSRPAKPSTDPSLSQSQGGSTAASKAADGSQGSVAASQEYRTSSGRRARRAAVNMAEEALAESLSGSGGGSDSEDGVGNDEDAEEVIVQRVGLFGGEGGLSQGTGGAASAAGRAATSRGGTVWGTLSDLDSDDDTQPVKQASKKRSNKVVAVSDSSDDGGGSDDEEVEVMETQSAAGRSDGGISTGDQATSDSDAVAEVAPRKSVKRARRGSSASAQGRPKARRAQLKRSGTNTTAATGSGSSTDVETASDARSESGESGSGDDWP